MKKNQRNQKKIERRKVEEKICKFHAKGDCWFGERFRNKHVKINEGNRNQKEIKNAEKKKEETQIECRYYNKGYCRNGKNCKFRHGRRQEMKPERDRRELKKSTSVMKCKYGKDCKYGEECRFRHEDEREGMSENNIHFLVKEVVAVEIAKIRKLI